MGFDPILPENNSLISSEELRGQFSGLKELLDSQGQELGDRVTELGTTRTTMEQVENQTPAPIPDLDLLDLDVSDPPDRLEIIYLRDKLNELITALKR